MKLFFLAALCFVAFQATCGSYLDLDAFEDETYNDMLEARRQRDYLNEMAKRDYFRSKYDYFQRKRSCTNDSSCKSILGVHPNACTESTSKIGMLHPWVLAYCKPACGKC
ncbi:uncharacterized protein [Clytia hemisphaerica]|uniref:ShKT domain-containing protein n=1 Tax=Clytia hemisphaerica TaxID=252671 RepID=A0A7M5X2X1_9CNID